METQIGNPDNLWLMGMVFVTVALAMFVAWQRGRALKRLATANLLPSLLPTGITAPWISTALLSAAFLFLTLSLLDLRWGKTEYEIPQKGIEVVFALDVSRSMLAEDAKPNRLERAKQQIKDLMDEMVGDRVGLVAFAGEAKALIPLTSHYDDFKSTLDGVGPQSIRVGGSRLGTALDTSAKSFLEKSSNHKAIVLLTDGEDQESDPVGIAERIYNESGIRVFTIGLGDWKSGSKIPASAQASRLGEDYLTYQGDTVLSKQDGETLKAMALASSGAYIPAGTKYVDMRQVYAAYIAPIEKIEFETATVQAYEAKFQWFALPAFFCLIVELFWRTRNGKSSRQKRIQKEFKVKSTVAKNTSAALAIVAFFAISNTGQDGWAQSSQDQIVLPADVAQRINQANQKLVDGDFETALKSYESMGDLANGKQLLNYNRGLAFHAAGELSAAAEAFAQSATSPNRELAARSRYNLGNCLVESTMVIDETAAAKQEELSAAKQQLARAIQSYRDALRLDPGLDDARANIETAYHRLKRLQDQEQQQQDSDSQQQQESEQQDSGQDQESQAAGGNPSEQNKGGQQQGQEKDQEQSSENQPSSDSNENQQSEQQGSGSEQAKDEKSAETEPSEQPGDERQQSQEKSTPSDQAKSSEDQQEKNGAQPESTGAQGDESSAQQQDAGQPSEGNSQQEQDANQSQQNPLQNSSSSQPSKDQVSDSDSESKNQPMANSPDGQTSDDRQEDADDAPGDEVDPRGAREDAGELSSANEDFAAATPGTTEEQAGTMTLQEAMKILQSIRDRNFQRRAELQRREQMRHVPVEKDW